MKGRFTSAPLVVMLEGSATGSAQIRQKPRVVVTTDPELDDANFHQTRALGLTTLRLETNKALAQTIAPYRSADYREVPAFNDEPYTTHRFEKRLRPRDRRS